jgi:hypothetical protein
MSRVRYQDRPHLSADPSMQPATIQLITSVGVGDACDQVPLGNLFAGGPVFGRTFPPLIVHDYMAAALAGQLVADLPAAPSGPRSGAR